MAPDGSGRVKVDLGADTDIYLARVDWTPDGTHLARPAREPRPEEARPAERRSGDRPVATILFSETSQTWINLHDNLRRFATAA